MTGTAGRAHHAGSFLVSIRKMQRKLQFLFPVPSSMLLSTKCKLKAASMQEIFNFPEVIGVGNTAELFGFSRETAYRLIRSGDILSCRIAGRRLITSRSVRNFILRQVKEQSSIDQNAGWLGTFMVSCSSVPVLLSISKVSSRFGISRRSAYRLAASGKIVTIKIGRSRFIVTESIQYYIQRSITFRQPNVGTPGADLRS
ncbi:helix-turn-helix domain-containing protein [Acetobacter tropicalis]|uniref:helix-turn-helix domain-containing protein n=1 Tax=Acetobacter tropicalis TaxID=104102 RepID=UPI00222FC2DA|nr:helix-turn-helix domain-containing protein [Acetobacter tropicalis]